MLVLAVPKPAIKGRRVVRVLAPQPDTGGVHDASGAMLFSDQPEPIQHLRLCEGALTPLGRPERPQGFEVGGDKFVRTTTFGFLRVLMNRNAASGWSYLSFRL